jgi:hypothetical protein
LYDLIFDIVIEGVERFFAVGHPEIELGSMYGILMNKNGQVAISNEIFELLITNYLSEKLRDTKTAIDTVLREDIIQNGRFDMELCLMKFSQHYHELYDKQDTGFLERQGRLLFITYLKPFINGHGFCHIETQTRNALRMDLVVDYKDQQFIVELKLWHGDKGHADAYRQLFEYLAARNTPEGYLLTFDFRKGKKKTEPKWIDYKGKRIFDIVV